MENHSQQKLRIAISGGGLAGAAIANALFRHPHIDVHVYEAAPEFSERGMAVNLGINAQNALAVVLPDGDTAALFKRAGAVKVHSTRVMIGSGPQAGTHVTEIADEVPPVTVHRANFLYELLTPLPEANKHAAKKLSAINERASGLLLKFEDGTETEVDALIGADGLFGIVRKHILGDHPSANAVAAGWSATRNLVTYAEAKKKLGEQWFQEDCQYAWAGHNGFIMHDVLNDGDLVQCIGASVDQDDKESRKKTLQPADLEARFAEWKDGPIAKGMLELLLDQSEIAAYAHWEFPDAPTYYKGKVTVAGDAAHAFTPWQGAGAGMALEDAAMLGTLFAEIKRVNEIEAVFKAFDTIRRPRTQKIAESSRTAGRIFTGIEESIGLDPVRMKKALLDSWRYILHFDLEKHREEGRAALRSALGQA